LERSGVRVLLLDDEPFMLKMHAHLLKEAGFVSIRAFESGALALADIELGNTPDLILLDLSMPEMDGIEFIRHLVARKYKGRVILVSGEDERTLQTAFRLVASQGIDILGHLAKPVKPAILRGLVENWDRRTAFIPRGPGKIYDAAALAKALGNHEVVNHYQPKVSLLDGSVQGVESLARWEHPQDGLVPPLRFIGVAEQNGLIDELSRGVFRKALLDLREMERSGTRLQVAVNMAASTLGSVDFADFAVSETSRASVSPTDVTIELTESQLISDHKAPLDVLTRLRLMRFRLSIDDFGTGYSSLAQLRDIPFDELKVDQSFVHHAATDKAARAMYDASIGLARHLGMKTVAEGVENRDDWDLVRNTGCDAAQGFFIARPMPASALPAWIEQWRERAKDLYA
jgi:EAL domain-containing protein (putative c-di-GMP-specific phosphodiesterase class I)/ActR/RegA family two-component response regulator